MRDSILQKIFRRVQISRSEGIVLDAILSKANLFGKHARVAYEGLAGITDQRAHLRRNIRFCITFCQTMGYEVIKQRANVTDLLLTACSGALLSHKSIRKPVQKSKSGSCRVKPYLSV